MVSEPDCNNVLQARSDITIPLKLQCWYGVGAYQLFLTVFQWTWDLSSREQGRGQGRVHLGQADSASKQLKQVQRTQEKNCVVFQIESGDIQR